MSDYNRLILRFPIILPKVALYMKYVRISSRVSYNPTNYLNALSSLVFIGNFQVFFQTFDTRVCDLINDKCLPLDKKPFNGDESIVHISKMLALLLLLVFYSLRVCVCEQKHIQHIVRKVNWRREKKNAFYIFNLIFEKFDNIVPH